MRKLILAAAFSLISAQAFAACASSDDVQKKAMELATVVQQLAQKNPQKAQEWSQKTMKATQEFQASGTMPTDFNKACAFYDTLIEDAKKGL